MDKMLTASEIKSQYQSEWVLIENPQTDEMLDVSEKPAKATSSRW